MFDDTTERHLPRLAHRTAAWLGPGRYVWLHLGEETLHLTDPDSEAYYLSVASAAGPDNAGAAIFAVAGPAKHRLTGHRSIALKSPLEASEIAQIDIAVELEIERFTARIVRTVVWASHAVGPVDEII